MTTRSYHLEKEPKLASNVFIVVFRRAKFLCASSLMVLYTYACIGAQNKRNTLPLGFLFEFGGLRS